MSGQEFSPLSVSLDGSSVSGDLTQTSAVTEQTSLLTEHEITATPAGQRLEPIGFEDTTSPSYSQRSIPGQESLYSQLSQNSSGSSRDSLLSSRALREASSLEESTDTTRPDGQESPTNNYQLTQYSLHQLTQYPIQPHQLTQYPIQPHHLTQHPIQPRSHSLDNISISRISHRSNNTRQNLSNISSASQEHLSTSRISNFTDRNSSVHITVRSKPGPSRYSTGQVNNHFLSQYSFKSSSGDSSSSSGRSLPGYTELSEYSIDEIDKTGPACLTQYPIEHSSSHVASISRHSSSESMSQMSLSELNITDRSSSRRSASGENLIEASMASGESSDPIAMFSTRPGTAIDRSGSAGSQQGEPDQKKSKLDMEYSLVTAQRASTAVSAVPDKFLVSGGANSSQASDSPSFDQSIKFQPQVSNGSVTLGDSVIGNRKHPVSASTPFVQKFTSSSDEETTPRPTLGRDTPPYSHDLTHLSSDLRAGSIKPSDHSSHNISEEFAASSEVVYPHESIIIDDVIERESTQPSPRNSLERHAASMAVESESCHSLDNLTKGLTENGGLKTHLEMLALSMIASDASGASADNSTLSGEVQDDTPRSDLQLIGLSKNDTSRKDKSPRNTLEQIAFEMVEESGASGRGSIKILPNFDGSSSSTFLARNLESPDAESPMKADSIHSTSGDVSVRADQSAASSSFGAVSGTGPSTEQVESLSLDAGDTASAPGGDKSTLTAVTDIEQRSRCSLEDDNDVDDVHGDQEDGVRDVLSPKRSLGSTAQAQVLTYKDLLGDIEKPSSHHSSVNSIKSRQSEKSGGSTDRSEVSLTDRVAALLAEVPPHSVDSDRESSSKKSKDTSIKSNGDGVNNEDLRINIDVDSDDDEINRIAGEYRAVLRDHMPSLSDSESNTSPLDSRGKPQDTATPDSEVLEPDQVEIVTVSKDGVTQYSAVDRQRKSSASDTDDTLDNDVRRILAKYGRNLSDSEDESSIKPRSYKGESETESKGIHHRVSNLLYGKPGEKLESDTESPIITSGPLPSYLFDDPSKSMSLPMELQSTMDSIPSAAMSNKSKGDYESTASSKSAAGASAFGPVPPVFSYEEPSKKSSQKQSAKRKSSDQLGKNTSRGSSQTSSLAGSVDYENLEKDLDEMELGLVTLRRSHDSDSSQNSSHRRQKHDTSKLSESSRRSFDPETGPGDKSTSSVNSQHSQRSYRSAASGSGVDEPRESLRSNRSDQGSTGFPAPSISHESNLSKDQSKSSAEYSMERSPYSDLRSEYSAVPRSQYMSKDSKSLPSRPDLGVHALLTSGVVPLDIALDIVHGYDRPPDNKTRSSTADLLSPTALERTRRSSYESSGREPQDQELSEYRNTSAEPSEKSYSEKVLNILERDSPTRHAYSYLTGEGLDELSKVSYRTPVSTQPRIDQEEQVKLVASGPKTPLNQIQASPGLEFNITPMGDLPPFKAFGNVRSLFGTHMDKVAKSSFDKSIEMRTPLRRHLDELDIEEDNQSITIEHDAVKDRYTSPAFSLYSDTDQKVKQGSYDYYRGISGREEADIKRMLMNVHPTQSPTESRLMSALRAGLGDDYNAPRNNTEPRLSIGQKPEPPMTGSSYPIPRQDTFSSTAPVYSGPQYSAPSQDGKPYSSTMPSETRVSFGYPASSQRAPRQDSSIYSRPSDADTKQMRSDYTDPSQSSFGHSPRESSVLISSRIDTSGPGLSSTRLDSSGNPIIPGPSLSSTRLDGTGPSIASTRLDGTGPSIANTRLDGPGPSLSSTRLDGTGSRTHGSLGSNRSVSPISQSRGTLRPFRPAGGQDMYYVESGTEDGQSTVTVSEATVESTHLSSDDARGPPFPPQVYGSRTDEPGDTEGIYSKKKPSTGDDLILSTIQEQPSMDSRDAESAKSKSNDSEKSKKEEEEERSFKKTEDWIQLMYESGTPRDPNSKETPRGPLEGDPNLLQDQVQPDDAIDGRYIPNTKYKPSREDNLLGNQHTGSRVDDIMNSLSANLTKYMSDPYVASLRDFGTPPKSTGHDRSLGLGKVDTSPSCRSYDNSHPLSEYTDDGSFDADLYRVADPFPEPLPPYTGTKALYDASTQALDYGGLRYSQTSNDYSLSRPLGGTMDSYGTGSYREGFSPLEPDKDLGALIAEEESDLDDSAGKSYPSTPHPLTGRITAQTEIPSDPRLPKRYHFSDGRVVDRSGSPAADQSVLSDQHGLTADYGTLKYDAHLLEPRVSGYEGSYISKGTSRSPKLPGTVGEHYPRSKSPGSRMTRSTSPMFDDSVRSLSPTSRSRSLDRKTKTGRSLSPGATRSPSPKSRVRPLSPVIMASKPQFRPPSPKATVSISYSSGKFAGLNTKPPIASGTKRYMPDASSEVRLTDRQPRDSSPSQRLKKSYDEDRLQQRMQYLMARLSPSLDNLPDNINDMWERFVESQNQSRSDVSSGHDQSQNQSEGNTSSSGSKSPDIRKLASDLNLNADLADTGAPYKSVPEDRIGRTHTVDSIGGPIPSSQQTQASGTLRSTWSPEQTEFQQTKSQRGTAADMLIPVEKASPVSLSNQKPTVSTTEDHSRKQKQQQQQQQQQQKASDPHGLSSVVFAQENGVDNSQEKSSTPPSTRAIEESSAPPPEDADSTLRDSPPHGETAKKTAYLIRDETLASVPEDSTLDSISSDFTTSSYESDGKLILKTTKRHLPDDPKLLRLQHKILKQKEKYKHDRLRELKRKERIAKLERVLAERNITMSHSAKMRIADQAETMERPPSAKLPKKTSTPSSKKQVSLSSTSDMTSLTMSDITSTSSTMTPSSFLSDDNTLTEAKDTSPDRSVERQSRHKPQGSRQHDETRNTTADTSHICTCQSNREPEQSMKRSKSSSPDRSHKQKHLEKPESLKLKQVHYYDQDKPTRLSGVSYFEFDKPEPQKSRRPKSKSPDKSNRTKSRSPDNRQPGRPKSKSPLRNKENHIAKVRKHTKEEQNEQVKRKKRNKDASNLDKKKDFGQTFPTPFSLSPVKQDTGTVTMVSQGIQTLDLSRELAKIQKQEFFSAKKKATAGMFTPEGSMTEVNVKAKGKKDKLDFTAGQSGMSWFVPMSDPRPWRKPLLERQAHAVAMDTWSDYDAETRRKMREITLGLAEGPGSLRQSEGTDILRTRLEGTQYSQGKMTLKDAFEDRMQEFISRSRERERYVRLRGEERRIQELHHSERERLFEVRKKIEANLQAYPLSDLHYKPQRRKLSKKEIKEHTKKMYKKLPEVVQKIEDRKRQESYKTNRLKARIFQQKVQNKVLNKYSTWA